MTYPEDYDHDSGLQADLSKSTAASLVALVLCGIAALFAVAVFGCSTARGLTRLDEMGPDEFMRYQARVSLQVQTVAAALLAEGDVTIETAQLVALTLDGLAAGTAAPGAGGLVEALDIQGYGALAVQLAVVELDAALEERGAYEEGGWALAAQVVASVAAGIRAAAEGAS